MITESKVTEFFCIADDFCKEFEVEMAKNALLQSPRANAILAKMFEKFGRRSGKIKFLPWSSI